MAMACACPVLLIIWSVITFYQVATWKDSFTVFQNAVDVVPNNYFAYNHLGLAYWNKGERERNESQMMEKDAQQVEKQGRHLLAQQIHQQAKERLNEADADRKQGGDYFAEAFRIAPDYDSCSSNLGLYKATMGNLEGAAKCFENAVKVNPYFAAAYANLGLTQLNQNKIDEAIVNLQKAVELSPDGATMRMQLGMALAKKSRMKEAVVQWVEVAKLCPNDVLLLNNIAALLATSPDDSVRNGKEAVRFATQAVELTGWHEPVVIDTLGMAYAEAGDFSEAARLTQMAANLATQQNQPKMAEAFKRKIKLYESGIPIREKTGPGAASERRPN
jgi:Flp pilus assembly protein TadD